MNLVEIKNDQPVTTSLQVAGNFEKQHKDVLEAYDNLLKTGVAEKSADLFWEDTYIHPQNKQEYRMIYMNRDGFSLLAMGFTGKKALQFKLKYIEQFNKMEEQLKQEQLPESNLELALRAALEHEEKLKVFDDRLIELEENKAISPGDYNYLSKRVNQRVSEIARSFAPVTAKQRGELHRDINNGIKAITGVMTRSQLREKNLQQVLDFINDREPSTATKTLIRQMSLDI